MAFHVVTISPSHDLLSFSPRNQEARDMSQSSFDEHGRLSPCSPYDAHHHHHHHHPTHEHELKSIQHSAAACHVASSPIQELDDGLRMGDRNDVDCTGEGVHDVTDHNVDQCTTKSITEEIHNTGSTIENVYNTENTIEQVYSNESNNGEVHSAEKNNETVQNSGNSIEKVHSKENMNKEVDSTENMNKEVHSTENMNKDVHSTENMNKEVHSTENMNKEVHSTENTNKEVHSTENMNKEVHSTENMNNEVHSAENMNKEVHSAENMNKEVHSTENTNKEVHSTENMNKEVHSTENMNKDVHSTENMNKEVHSTENMNKEVHSTENTNKDVHSTENMNKEVHSTENMNKEVHSTENTNKEVHSTENNIEVLPNTEINIEKVLNIKNNNKDANNINNDNNEIKNNSDCIDNVKTSNENGDMVNNDTANVLGVKNKIESFHKNTKEVNVIKRSKSNACFIKNKNKRDALKRMRATRTCSPDYDNLMYVWRLSQVAEEDGEEEEKGGESMNELCFNSAVNSSLDASGVGGVGPRGGEGGPVDGESKSPRVGLGYKSGYGDSISNTGSCSDYTDGDLDVSCAGVVVESAADVNRIDMGNDLFKTRGAASVSDARAEVGHVSGNRKRVHDRLGSRREMCSNRDNKTRVTNASCNNILHECKQDEASRVSLCVVSPECELSKCEQRKSKTDKSPAYEMSVFSSRPTESKAQPNFSAEATYVSSIPNGGKKRQSSSATNSSGINASSTTSTTFTSDTTTRAVNKGISANYKTVVNHHREVRDQDHQQVTILKNSTRDAPSNPTSTKAATYIPLASVSTPARSVIIIPSPSIPNNVSQISSPDTFTSNSTRDPTPLSTETSKKEETSPAASTDEQSNVQLKVHSPNMQHTNASKKSSPKSTPVGGVKVLPSSFTFNFRAFKETRTSHTPEPTLQTPSATQQAPDRQPHPESTRSAKETISSDTASKDFTRISENASTKDISTSNIFQAVNAAELKVPNSLGSRSSDNKQQFPAGVLYDMSVPVSTEYPSSSSARILENQQESSLATKTATSEKKPPTTSVKRVENKHSSQISVNSNIKVVQSVTSAEKTLLPNMDSLENKQQFVEGSCQSSTYCRAAEDYSWNDYAVPSDLSPGTPESGYQSPETQVSSPGQNRKGDATDGNTASIKETNRLIIDDAGQTLKRNSARENTSSEDIYAIPIPKNQRQAGTLQSGRHDASHSQTATVVQSDEPPRLPVPNAEGSLIHTNCNDALENVVLRHPAISASQMKKSTTTDMLQFHSNDYSSIPNTISRKYDYFSLGRRPRRPRIRTLIDSQGIAVSLDVLLKSRRQSVLDDSICSEVDQTLSVDDIMKSCSDFEESYVMHKSKTIADSGYALSVHPMTFNEVNSVKFLQEELDWAEIHEPHYGLAKLRPVAKKGTGGNITRDNSNSLGRSHVRVSQGDTGKGETNGNTPHSAEAMVGLSRPSHSSDFGIEALERKPSTTSPLVANQNETLKPSQDNVQSVEEQDFEITLENKTTTSRTVEIGNSPSGFASLTPKTEVADAKDNKRMTAAQNAQLEDVKLEQKAEVSENSRKPEEEKSSFDAHSETNEINHVISNETRIKVQQGSNVKPESSESGSTFLDQIINPDYEYPKDTIHPSMSPGEVGVSLKEVSPQNSTHQTDSSVSTSATDIKPLDTVNSTPTSTTAAAQQPASPVLNTHKEVELTAPIRKVSNVDVQPDCQHHMTVSLSTSSQEATLLPDSQTSTPELPVSLSTTSPVEVNQSFRNPSSSSSDTTTSPRSLRTGSDSSSVTSPGVMSSLSVDVSGGSTSPARKSPNFGSKLEALEALKWLRAAGFPQYAQMFDDGQFPVDMGVVERDHDFLDKDSLQSLFRRLDTLNKCAGIRLDALPSKKATSEEEDEDDFCALSERWEYQKSARRWSRKDLTPSQKDAAKERSSRGLSVRSGSHDSLLADQDSESQTGDSPLFEPKMPHQLVVQHHGMASLSHGGHAVAEISPEEQKGSPISPHLRRAASERIKTAKSLFKKMDGLKTSKSRRQTSNKNIMEISGPVLADRDNMQIKLDRLNCVDISQPAENLHSPPLGQVKTTRFVSSVSSSSSTGGDGNPSSPDMNQPSLHSPASPRPHSDFVPRPKDATFSPHSSSTHSRPNRSYPTQNSSSHDSSFDEYYHAKTTFLQNLQSPKGLPAEGVRKNNSDTNLVEIFLVPQDHRPGRFPRMLQNGYIETEACGTAVNVRTGSVRLGRGTGLTSDSRSPNSRMAQPPSSQGEGQRISVYDNFLPMEGKKLEGNEARSVIPGVIQLDTSMDSSSFSRAGVEGNKHELVQEVNSESNQWDSTDASRDSSVARTIDSQSDQEHTGSSQDRSVTFESLSSSSQTLRESSSSTKEALTGDDSMSSKRSSVDLVSPNSRGVAHSASVDSYFHDGGSSNNSEAPSSDSTGKETSGTFQQHYDEFDRILQELYQNINDLTTFMDRDKNEKTPKLIRAATSPLPAGKKHSHPALHVATPPSARLHPTVDTSSLSLATSDLVPSPASPTSPRSPSESMDFYRGLDNDNENSSSGGEGNTAESGSEDQEAALTDVSHDDSLDQIIEVSRERRDSGVGHSLTRASSDRRHKKIRWHSFQKSHRPDITSRAMQINSLTIGQLVRLQKLSLLRLTGIMEKCLPVNKSGWNWMVPRFMKRHKAPDFSDKNVFGVPLSVMAQRTGQPMPQCILYAMRYLRCTCQSAVGLFRKSGVKSKIQQLRDHLEAHPDTTNFDDENTYNVADMLKTYFRDLPECLLTNKMSETFRSIYTYVPQPQRLEAIQAAILLLPDENREVLQSILLFLSDIADHEKDHQMNASNLAVCFTPTVFHLGPRQSLPYSPKRNRKNSTGIPDPREIMEQKAAHECLLMMITESKKLFTVPHNIFRQLQVQSMAHMEPTLPQDIGNSPSEVRAFGQERIQVVLKESHDKNRGWIPTLTINEVEVFHRKPIDDCPLKEWKMVVDIEAPPIEVLRRIMHERHTWDEDLLSWSVVERLDPYSDIFQFVLNSMAPHPPRNFCVLRYWRSDLNKGACSLITMSVQHSDALEIHGVWAMDHGTYFLMEPCGSGRSRLTYITRMDTKGRMPEWYTKIFGHISANFLERLKESFKQDASGPETKV